MNEPSNSIKLWMSQAYGFYKVNFVKLVPMSILFCTAAALCSLFISDTSVLQGFFGLFISIFIYGVYKYPNDNVWKITQNQVGFKNALWTYWSYSWRTILLLFLLVIPGIIYSIKWVFYVFASLDKDLKGKSALDYSKKTVKGNWWRLLFLSIICSPIILVSIIALLLKESNIFTDIIVFNIIGLINMYFYTVLLFAFINLDKLNNQMDVNQSPAQVTSTDPTTVSN